MIRPITCVGFLLACGSGLYLYQAKHRVNVIDQEIARTVHATDTTREQIRLLHAEWTLLNQPDRLQKLADQFLALKPTAPGQFTSLADLDSRLPPVRPDAPPPAPAEMPANTAVAAATPVAPPEPTLAPAPARHDEVAEKKPEPPHPVSKPVERPRVMVAEPRPVRPAQEEYAMQRPPAPVPMRPAYIPAAGPRPYWAAPRAVPVATSPAYAPPPPTGSVLGIARQGAAPAPPAPAVWHTGN